MPSLVDVVVRDALVDGLISVAVAPGTTLPCGSVTVPRTVEVPACPSALTAAVAISKRIPSVKAIVFARRLCLFMFPPGERVVLKLRFLKLTVILGALSTNESLLLSDAKLTRKNRNY